MPRAMSRELSSVKFPQNRNGVRFATRFLVGTQMRFPLHLRSTRKLTLNEAQIVTIVGEHFGILAMRPKIKATAESTCRAMLFGKFIRRWRLTCNEVLGNYRRQSQQSRMEFGLRFSGESSRENDLDCGCAPRRKALRYAGRGKADVEFESGAR